MAPVDGSQSVQSLGGGYFSVDGQTLSFEDLVFNVQQGCVQTTDIKFAQKFSEISDRNKLLQELSDFYTMLNTYNDSFDKDGNRRTNSKGDCSLDNDNLAKFNTEDMLKYKNDTTTPPSGYFYDLIKSGIVDDGSSGGTSDKGIGTDGIFSKKELEITVENIKAVQDSRNSENEMDMMTLNKLSGQRSTFFQLWSTQLSLIKEARSAAAAR
jgi:hypothetical protein